jgi:V-type H+-transporting ATPase proteolipid subunit
VLATVPAGLLSGVYGKPGFLTGNNVVRGFMHLASGLSVGLAGLAAGYTIGIVGDVVSIGGEYLFLFFGFC